MPPTPGPSESETRAHQAPPNESPAGDAPVADAARVPFEVHVADDAEVDAADRPWVELARTSFHALAPAFTLRATAVELPGLSLVQLVIVADPDGRSGTSNLPTALLRAGEAGAWSFVHVSWDLPGTAGLTEATALTDVNLHFSSCDADAQHTVLAAPPDRRNATVVESCQSLDGEVASAFLATAEGAELDRVTTDLLSRIRAAKSPTQSFRIPTRRSGEGGVGRDLRWLERGAFTPWSATRDGDVVDAAGTMLLGRTWYALALRVDAGVTLRLSVVGLANSHGVPP